MKLIILINSNSDLESINDCKTKSEFFAFMFKTYISQFEGISLVIEKCIPELEMKITFKNNVINNIRMSDHIIYIGDTGLSNATQSFTEYLKTKTTSISTICKGIKYYNGEDNLFTYNYLSLYPNYYEIKPPLDPLIYSPRKEKDVFYILLDSMPDNLSNFPSDAKVGLISHDKIKIIQPIQETIKFNMYIDYIYELSKANVCIIDNSINDIYFLYELAMCNTLSILKYRAFDEKIIKKLQFHMYTDHIDWDKIKDIKYNARDHLVKHNYTWKNAIQTIISKLKSVHTLHSSTSEQNKSNIGYCLNIQNKNKPVVIEFKEDNYLDEQQPEPIQRKVILQSQLLN